jgi:hypothetical protein
MTGMETWISVIGLVVVALLQALNLVWTKRLEGYGMERGKNQATHADIQMLREDQAKLTQSVESVRQSILHEYWTTQRMWELKKEAIFDAVKELSELQHAVFDVSVQYRISDANPTNDDCFNKAIDSATRYNKQISSFWRARTLVFLTCSGDVTVAFVQLGQKLLELNRQKDGSVGGANKDLSEHAEEITCMLADLGHLIRRELEPQKPKV